MASLLSDLQGRFRYDLPGFIYLFPWGDGVLSGVEPEEWQLKLARSVSDRLRAGAKRPADLVEAVVISGRGVGKTAFCAWVSLWWLLTRVNCKGVITANTGDQIQTKTWPEIGKWLSMLPKEIAVFVNKTATRLSCTLQPDQWFLSQQTWSEERPEAMQGEHSDHGICIMDEASAMPQAIWDAVAGGLNTGHNLWLSFGNPTRPDGPFIDAQAQKGVIAMRVDSMEVKRSSVNKDLMRRWVEQWGDDSDFCRINIHGLPPRSGVNQFIPSWLIETARQRVIDEDAYSCFPRVLGVDVAGSGVDATVITRRQGPWLPPQPCRQVRGVDVVELADVIQEERRLYRAKTSFVDGVGIGAGTCAALKRLGEPFINVGAAGSRVKAQRAAAYDGGIAEAANLPTLLWARMRDWLRDGGSLYNAPKELLAELGGRQFYTTGQGRTPGLIMLEPKDSMRKSPDFADSLAMTFAANITVGEFDDLHEEGVIRYYEMLDF
jgi:hypothetical protein